MNNYKKITLRIMTALLPLAITAPATAQDKTWSQLIDYPALERAQSEANSQPGPRHVPAKTIPLPSTVSPRLSEMVSAPYQYPKWTGNHPQDTNDWKPFVATLAADIVARLGALRDRLGVTIEPATMGGVPVFVLQRRVPAAEHRNRVLLYIHGGGFLFNPGESGTMEATLIAGLEGFKVVSVDYRMIPDFPAPAALDDVTAVYKALLSQYDADRIGVVGTSAGGNLTLALMHRAKAERLPLPAAIAPATPWADLTEEGGGDTMETLEWVDNTLVSYKGYLSDAAPAYANGQDMVDPFLSPLRGNFTDFPPTILTSGTRDLFLSQTVLTHRKLRRAGVEAQLHVFEGMSHAQHMDADAPEAKEAYMEISSFFDKHLRR
ncbi:Acetyl esterase [Pseudomonas fluorescens]|uniref:Acetyl esterase n=1 Tax=Pseudomonas fluorescens TaxID=294 RepID=A0A5E7R080_PSEFL|nr:alpha/beta hydrolase [Pseudomonas fluorescens]VVP66747.1 Acetyl esterase [Pseudomonas fluorescens]